jgi:hypothetical protein
MWETTQKRPVSDFPRWTILNYQQELNSSVTQVTVTSNRWVASSTPASDPPHGGSV